MASPDPRTPTIADAVAALDARYPPGWAESWDRVGLVLGEPGAPLRRALFAVDCLPPTAAQARDLGADLLVVHHPLLLHGVSSVAPTTYQGRIVHDLIKGGIALFVAHTNADVANPGVSDALAARLGLLDLRPLVPPRADSPAGGDGRGIGRIGRLPAPMPLSALVQRAAAGLPATAWGVRAAGDPGRVVSTMAVCGGSGGEFLGAATAAGVDAYLTADLRHHPASEHLAGGGPALLDAAHWATERPWLDNVARWLGAELGIETVVSYLDTDPWTLHAASNVDMKERRP